MAQKRRKSVRNRENVPFAERPKPRLLLEGTLDYLFARIQHQVKGAIYFAAYSPLANEATRAIFDDFQAQGEPLDYSVDKKCRELELQPSEFVGIVVAGMSKAASDYSAVLKAASMPLIVESSLNRAIEGENYTEVSDWLIAEGHHIAPKAAQFNLNSNNQVAILTETSGLPSFEDSIGGEIERATRRALPESSSVPIDVEFEAKVPVPA